MSPSEEPQAPTPHTTKLAARLKQLRAEHGLSLAQLARATGISSSFLSLIEQAQTDVSIGRLVRLAEFYDLELADLLGGPPTAPSDHVRILRTAPDHMLHSPIEGVDVYDLTCGARWTLVPALSSFRPGGSIEIHEEHEHERMIYILDGTFELAFPGEPPTRPSERRGCDLPQRWRVSHHECREGTRPHTRSPRASGIALEPPARPSVSQDQMLIPIELARRPERHNPDVASSRPAMDAIPLIKARLAELGERGGQEPVVSGRLAALWRAQARAARIGLTTDDLRRYCLDMLRSRRALDDDAPAYLRGYREGFQLVLRDLRKLEQRG